jgi:uncharacterized protein involved in response to NO
MRQLAREPFRIFFPLGLALGAAGIAPWVLFGRGLSRVYPGPYHSLAMSQGFVSAFAVGFLGTMLPRRTGTAPLPMILQLVMVLALASLPIALLEHLPRTAELAAIVPLVALAGWFGSRAFVRRAVLRPPPSFVHLPLALLAGIGGALMIAFGHGATVLVGRRLAQQGFFLELVLAIAPMLGPALTQLAAPPPRRHALLRHLFAGAIVMASFAVEEWWSARLGLSARGLALAVIIIGEGQLLAPLARTGIHRHALRLSLWAVPLGVCLAGAMPAQRIQLLHVTFIGGVSLMIVAVSVHVTLLHGGRETLADRSPWPVVAAVGLTLAAALARVLAERLRQNYVLALTTAAELWLTAWIAWAAFLIPKLRRRRQSP